MGFRFFRRIKIAPGVSLNLGKRGASVSVGPRGAKMTFGSRGVRSSVGIPGTGIRYEKVYGRGSGSGQGVADGGGNVPTWMVICGLFAIGAFFSYQIYKGTHAAGALFAMFGCGIGGVLTLVFATLLSGEEDAVTVSKTGTSFQRAGGRWDSYIRELAYASQALYNFLRELNRSTRCRNQLKALPGMEPFDGASNEFTINKRLAAIVYCDVRDCFRRLGHSTSNLYNLEGMGYAMFVCLLINKGFQLSLFLDRGKAKELARIIGELDHTATVEVNIAGHENEFRFDVVFGKVNTEREWVQRFSSLLYRWASLVAKADGTVTPEESQMLESIMKMSDNSSSDGDNVRITGEAGDTTDHPRYETPDTDSKAQTDEQGTCSSAERTKKQRRGSLKTALRTLDELIGLEPVKKNVRALADFIRIQQKRQQAGLKLAPISYHCVFTGNPGTGKTTVARILAEIYREMGVVKKGHLVETDRSGLIAEYVGQTAVKTNKIIDKALDGVLFIDEAYSVVQGGENDYGREAIATLLKRMEDDRDRLVVVLAGYSEEMKDFINSNPGLQSRFNRYIDFPDYSAEELSKIFLLLVEKSQYKCDQDVCNSIVQIMERAVAQKDRNFGNGRYVRNLFENAIQRQAVRLSGVAPLTSEMLAELTLHDLGFAYED